MRSSGELTRWAFDHVQQACGTAAVVSRGQVDDQCDEPGRADSPGRPAMLIDADHPHPGEAVRPASSDQAGDGTHGDGADALVNAL